MKLSVSVSNCKNKIDSVLELNRTNTSYIHIDVTYNQFNNIGEIKGVNLVSKYPLDIHLMVDDPINYINELKDMNIEFVTINFDIYKDKKVIFNNIKELGYKVGLAINHNTNLNDIESYLDDIDLILIMNTNFEVSKENFTNNIIDKIKELKELIEKCGKNILIEVDSEINKQNMSVLWNADIIVVSSYVTNSDNYYGKVEELLNFKELDKNIIETSRDNYEDKSNHIEKEFTVKKEIDKIDMYISFIILEIIFLISAGVMLYLHIWQWFAITILLLFYNILNTIFIFVYIIDIFKSINKKSNFINNKAPNIKLLTSKYKKLLSFGIGKFLFLITCLLFLFYKINSDDTAAIILIIAFPIVIIIIGNVINSIINSILLIVISLKNLLKFNKNSKLPDGYNNKSINLFEILRFIIILILLGIIIYIIMYNL